MDISVEYPPRREEAKRLYGLEGRFVVLQPGIISPHKNQMESIKAVQVLRHKIKDIVLVFTGLAKGSYRKALDAYIKAHALEKHVIFTGHIKDTRNLYRATDVAVFPEKSEGGWLYPMEVISSGAALVVSKAFAAGGVIGRERLGLVTDDMPSAIEYIFQNPAKSRLATDKAFSWINRNLGWNNFTGKMVDVFNNVIPQSGA
jgi:glycosyltransferase involved in cell wall biosynthesis